MRGRMLLFAAALAGLMLPLAPAQAWIRIGIAVPIGPYYGPYYRPYYYPYPRVLVAPAPVVVQPAPIYVQPAPAPGYQPAPASATGQSGPAQPAALAPTPRPLPN